MPDRIQQTQFFIEDFAKEIPEAVPTDDGDFSQILQKEQDLPTRIFLGWDGVLIEKVARWLLGRGHELAELLVIVPTSHSRRRLQLKLAELSENESVILPRLMTPSEFVQPNYPALASDWETRLAWVDILREHFPQKTEFQKNTGDFPEEWSFQNLFSIYPENTSFKWALNVAGELLEARETLAESGMTFADVARVVHGPRRWHDLESIEKEAVARLSSWGFSDKNTAISPKTLVSNGGICPKEIVFACVPDPVPTLLKIAATFLEQGTSVKILVHAPQSLSGVFDAWGRPEVEFWQGTEIDIPQAEEKIIIAPDAATLSENLLEAIGTSFNSDVSLGVCSESVMSSINRELTKQGWKPFQPAGQKIRDHGIVCFLKILHSLIADSQAFDGYRILMHSEWFDGFFAANSADSSSLEKPMPVFSRAKLVERLQYESLPATIHQAISQANKLAEQSDGTKAQSWQEFANLCFQTQKIISSFKDSSVINFLGKCCVCWRRIQPMPADGEKKNIQQIEILDALQGALNSLARLEKTGVFHTQNEVFEVLLKILDESIVYGDFSEAVIDLNGWLEVAYEAGRKLILAGFHEGEVPDSEVEGVFLPESVRVEINKSSPFLLKLRTRAQRAARDAFLFAGAIESRRQVGSVTVLACKFDEQGNSCQPSSLLMRCALEELSSRVSKLFSKKESRKNVPIFDRGNWKIHLETVPNRWAQGAAISPTEIRAYLECPTRCFLRNQLGFNRFNSGFGELDYGQFGTVLHAVLENFGRDEESRELTCSKKISAFFAAELERVIENRFGKSRLFALNLQIESIAERLHQFAQIQAQERASGWQIKQVEFSVSRHDPWLWHGFPMSLRIDRIEQNEHTGRWRIADYKSSQKGKTPEEVHLASFGALDPKWAVHAPFFAERKRNPLRWKDLQLPIYALFWREKNPSAGEIDVAYINLPSAVSETKIELFSLLSGDKNETRALPKSKAAEGTRHELSCDELLECAAACAREAMRRMRTGIFWPPAEMLGLPVSDGDEFSGIAAGDFRKAFSPETIELLKGSSSS